MSKLYLQNIVDDISFENLPAKWQGFDFSRFSKDKTLFDFQKQGLQNALKGLWLYFKGNTPSADADTPLQKGNIDIAETLSNLTGKWIKKITPRPPSASTPLKEGNYEIELEDGTKINIKDLDYKLIKPLIWWE